LGAIFLGRGFHCFHFKNITITTKLRRWGGVGELVREQAAAAVDALTGRRREVEPPLLFG
jgi:hypothetical protein